MAPYQQYIRYLHNKAASMTEQEQFEAPYLDYLQAPLQVKPLVLCEFQCLQSLSP